MMNAMDERKETTQLQNNVINRSFQRMTFQADCNNY